MKHENAIQCLQVMKGAECINALSQEFPEHYGIENMEALELAIEVLKKNRWIPCSERLPNNDEYDWVLAQVQEDNGHLQIPKVMEYRESINDWYLEGEFGGWLKEKHGDAFKVIAWMPLPPAYKEGEDGDN